MRNHSNHITHLAHAFLSKKGFFFGCLLSVTLLFTYSLGTYINYPSCFYALKKRLFVGPAPASRKKPIPYIASLIRIWRRQRTQGLSLGKYLSCVPGLMLLWLENRHGIHVSLADKDEKMKHLSARGGPSAMMLLSSWWFLHW